MTDFINNDNVRPNVDGVFPSLLSSRTRSFYGCVAMGNGTQFRLGVICTNYSVFVGVEDHGAHMFMGAAKAGYVHEKLSVMRADAGNLADFINDQIWPGVARQGRYNATFCSKGQAADATGIP